MLTLDHAFIWVSRGGKEADALLEAGFTEGPANTHPGQGTANRRFFFNTFMLELLWVENEAEATSPTIAPTSFMERWQGRGKTSSPFGLVFRSDDEEKLPFGGWKFSPPYLPPGFFFWIGEQAPLLDQPLIFVMPPCLQAPPRKDAGGELEGFRELTGLNLDLPGNLATPSPFEDLDRVNVHDNQGHHLMTLEFDHNAQGQTLDLRPHLPLVIKS